jgi:predicted metal-dependent hydrolase
LRLLVEDGSARRTPTASHPEPESLAAAFLPGFDPNPGLVLRVSYPPRFARATVLATVYRHWDWVAAQVLRQRSAPPAPGRSPLVTGTRLWFHGRKLTLFVLPQTRRRPRLVLNEDRLLCHTSRPRPSDVRRAVETWYRQHALELIGERVRVLAQGLTERTHSWRLRSQKSRWGSCTAEARLHFNWKLVMMPDFVVNYVVVHELAHLEELNHSSRFWQMVRHHCPYADTARRWLRRHGPELDW